MVLLVALCYSLADIGKTEKGVKDNRLHFKNNHTLLLFGSSGRMNQSRCATSLLV